MRNKAYCETDTHSVLEFFLSYISDILSYISLKYNIGL